MSSHDACLYIYIYTVITTLSSHRDTDKENLVLRKVTDSLTQQTSYDVQSQCHWHSKPRTTCSHWVTDSKPRTTSSYRVTDTANLVPRSVTESLTIYTVHLY